MNWLMLVFALELGWQHQAETMLSIHDPGIAEAFYSIESPYTKLEAGIVLFGFLEAGGDALIYIEPLESMRYAPYDARFTFYTRLRYKAFSVGWEHLCIHPMMSVGRPEVGYLRGGGDRIFLRVEAKLNPFS